MTDSHDPSSHAPLLAYLRMLAGPAEPGRFLDVRWRRAPGRMQRRFLSTRRVEDAARVVLRLAGASDVYVGVSPRKGHSHGGRTAISAMHLAYVESDSVTTAALLSAFACPPSIVIASGTPGHLQVYWRLERPYPPAEVEAANRRLAFALDADPACSDAARILRPPQTLNHKHSPPAAVRLLVLRCDVRYSLSELTSRLPKDPTPPRDTPSREGPRTGRTPLDHELLAIPAKEYVRVLAGLSPNREGKVCCPFHEDRNPSLQLYPDGGFYCFGSGCGAGGSIFDFAARLWGISPRGVGFIELRERLAAHFRLTAARCG